MPVELGYFTLPVPDVPRAVVFYGKLFGWQFENPNENGAHVSNTKFPIGLSRGGPANLPHANFRVDDLKEMLARLREFGGTVQSENEYPSGLNAVCRDDQATVFSLWQPAEGF